LTPKKRYQARRERCDPPRFWKISGIGGIEPFEITIFIRLFLAGLESEKGAVGMVLADIGNTEPQ
jgi:hypothetical protein